MRKGKPDTNYFVENHGNEVLFTKSTKTSPKSRKVFNMWFVKELVIIDIFDFQSGAALKMT